MPFSKFGGTLFSAKYQVGKTFNLSDESEISKYRKILTSVSDVCLPPEGNLGMILYPWTFPITELLTLR